jgi:glycosyltransferase involved in cell wall biosynthesis
MDKSNPVVSVVTAAYNVLPRDLHRSIRSILSQTYKDFELIIVDDASTDDTLKFVEAYAEKDDRVVVIRNKKNLGAGSSRNVGVGQARGEYIAIMDSDDFAHPRRLYEQISFLHNNPSVGLLGTAYQTISESGRKIQTVPRFETDTLIRWEMLLNSPFIHSSVMYKRELFLQMGGYSEKFPVSHDYDLFLRLSEITKMACLNRVLTYFQINSKGLSKTRKEIQFDLATHISHRAITQLMGEGYMDFDETKALREYLNYGKEFDNKDELMDKYLGLSATFSNKFGISRLQKRQIHYHIYSRLLWNWWNSTGKYKLSGLKDLYQIWRNAPIPLTYRLIRFKGGEVKRKLMDKLGR